MHVTDEWITNPGDILYIPPMYAHNGVAENDCMTFSIGFRAPNETDILQGISDLAAEPLTEFNRYSDKEADNASDSPALIGSDATQRLINMLKDKLLNENQVNRWLAETMTESKYEDLHEPLEDPLEWEDISPLFNPTHKLTQNETTRWAYFTSTETIFLFVNGIEYEFDNNPSQLKLISTLANNRHTPVADLLDLMADKNTQNILLDLINNNFLYFDQL